MMFPTIWYPKGLLKRILEVTLTPQGAYSGFQVTGMIEWSQKSRPQKIPRASSKTPKKSLDQKLTPKKSHADFVALKSSRKG